MTKKQKPVERKRVRSQYLFKGQPICRDAFLFIMDCSKNKLTAVSKHYQREGLTVRMNKARGRRISFEASKLALEFLDKYSQTHALQLPGRIPGLKRELLQLLPSSDTILSIYEKYKESCELSELVPVSKTSFRSIWKHSRPYMAVAKPMTDLCDMCQKQGSGITG